MRIKNLLQPISIVLIFIFSIFLSPLHAQDQNETIIIAVRAHSGPEAALSKWSATADYLSQSIKGYHFEMIPFVGFDEMKEAVEKNTVQFVLTNSAAYVELEQKLGIARIATLINYRGSNATKQFGGVIFTRADRADIENLSDVKGKSLMGVHQEAFGGWWMALGEFKKHDIEPNRDCSEVLFGGKQEPVVFAVKEGKADVGTVRSGIMERLAKRGEIDLAEFKIIGQQKDDFFLPHSTQLYPEWPFARTAAAPDELVKKVLATLMVMPVDSDAAIKGKYTGWTVPMDYSDVYTLMRELHVGPYKDHGYGTFMDFVTGYWQWFFFIFLTLIGSTGTALYIGRLHSKLRKSHDTLENKVRERTLHLQEEIGVRKRVEKEVVRERNNLHNILSTMDDGVYIVNSLYDIEYVNPALVKEFGAYEGLKCYLYFHNRDEVCPWCKNDDVCLGKTVQWEWTFAQGKTYDLLDTPIALAEGSTGKLGIFRDITERKQSQAELDKYQKHLEDFVKEQTNTLEEKVEELERMNDLFVGREFRIKVLRDKIKELESKMD